MTELQYFDSSVLVKAYLREPETDRALDALEAAPHPIASKLVQIEVLATLHRGAAGGRIRPSRLPRVVKAFEAQWSRMAHIPLDLVADTATRVCGQHRLRGADAIHLASCIELRSLGAEVRLVCSDGELLAAAEEEGFAALAI